MSLRDRASLTIRRRTVGMCVLALLLAAGAAGHGHADDITVYRCKDAGGKVTLQDSPCPAGQDGSARTMTRPQDPPPQARPAAPRSPPPPPVAAAEPVYDDYFAPPEMYECTDWDGTVRFSELDAPNVRCVPLSVLGYNAYGASAAACQWVEESCLRMDDAGACVQYRAKLRQARSDALHAFSDTAAFRKSEVERLTRIVDQSCR